MRLFHKSIEFGKTMGLEKSCTIYINGEKDCVHDGTWKECEVICLYILLGSFELNTLQNGHTVADFTRQINEAYDKLNA